MGTISNLKPWPKGTSGNPAGRPKGARSKLEEAFLADLQDSWQTHGSSVIERVVEKDPVSYLRVVANLMPRKEDQVDEENLTRDRVKRAISLIESWIAASGTEGNGPDPSESGQA